MPYAVIYRFLQLTRVFKRPCVYSLASSVRVCMFCRICMQTMSVCVYGCISAWIYVILQCTYSVLDTLEFNRMRHVRTIDACVSSVCFCM